MDTEPAVLHVCSSIDVGGAEKHLLSLCDGLTDRGLDVTVAYVKGNGELRAEFREAGCSVFSVGARTDADPLAFLRLFRHARSGSYDLVHGHLFHGNVYGITAGRLAGVPSLVSSKHNDPPFWDRQPWRAIHDVTLSQVDRILPISEHVREYLLSTTSVDPAKVRTVRYGLDPAEFDAVDTETVASVRREFVADDEPLVGTVARLTEQKNLDALLRAFERVLSAHPDAHLALVGRGEREADLRRLAHDLEIDDHVTFTGFREDVVPLMHAFDVFALPSKWEGFGVVFLEAMAAGTPVVASNVSAIPEVVADGQTGLLFPPEDVEGFAEAIADLLADPDSRERLGRQGRARLEAEFTVERVVDEVVEVYEALLGETVTDRGPNGARE